jgi:hypothetical protein
LEVPACDESSIALEYAWQTKKEAPIARIDAIIKNLEFGGDLKQT